MTVRDGPDGKPRCGWALGVPDFPGYAHYHDVEWGFPVKDDRGLFEKLCLESFQSGLSWRTILAKRDGFRAAFCNFEFAKVAAFTEEDVERLLQDEGIVRHHGKIEATINNAKRACEMVEQEGSLRAWFWQFEPAPEDLAEPQTASVSEEAKALSKNLKKLGWKFLGPTTVFAFMQAAGLINDHAEGCMIRREVEEARNLFDKPG